MARMSKAEKALQQEFTKTYNRLGDGVQVNVMDLGKIHNEALEAVKNGETMETAVAAVIKKYRKN